MEAILQMEGTRDRIVGILQRDGTGTVDGLSKALELAPATVRRHLDILQRDQLVTFTQVRKKTGRPEYSFSLTDSGHESMPNEYDVLLSELIEQLTAMTSGDVGGKAGSEILDLAFTRIGERVAEEYRNGSTDVARALQSALEARHTIPEFEQKDDGLHITVTNCPFRSVARSDDAVCTFHKSLISAITGSEVREESRIAHDDQCCSYVVPDKAN